MEDSGKSKIEASHKPEPPRLSDYNINSESEYKWQKSAPDVGGVAAILAEFDAATRSDQYSQALRKLIKSKHNIIPDLIARLDGDDLAIAKKAALALGYMQSPQAIPNLVEALGNPDRQLYSHAATALGCMGTMEAIRWLVKMLNHKSVQVQASVAKALARGGLSAVSPLVDILKRGEELVRIHAAHSLGQINSPLAVPALINALGDPVRTVRLEAAWALGQIRSPLACTALAARLTDVDLSVQSQAAQALKNIGSPCIPALSEMLKSPSSDTRTVAARTLGQMAIDQSVPLLIDVLYNDEFPHVRCNAAAALGEIGSVECIHPLAMMLKDGDRSVRNSAMRALRRINHPQAQEILKTFTQSINVPQYLVPTINHNENELDNYADYTILQ
ncbi:HEAT repeat-containing protein [Synechococcus sp. PCC 7502]|uniref:HEAT repeat domain-containing protein n=1 Tax=Synechococcus sp. PCC 7502 TaxID=1173263 RepID=UPI00029FD451|nr:HEAT repeat domain-containing protein [Synechococcus sp. PCC 7502]AFY73321.1 HEAT repeat-containing protein [Synechococcus sp. PCC 7502]